MNDTPCRANIEKKIIKEDCNKWGIGGKLQMIKDKRKQQDNQKCQSLQYKNNLVKQTEKPVVTN